MSEIDFLTAWARLVDDLGVDAQAGRDLGIELAARHSEPQRHYHTTKHIESVLEHLDRLHVSTPVARLAAFFHDSVYDPTRRDNEEVSAELAATSLAQLGVDQQVIDEVCAIVLATQTHTSDDNAPRETLAFLDADLAILGSPPDVYDASTIAIREEYAHMDDQAFARGRCTILRGFLDREILYYTSAGQAIWDAQARANLRRELEALGPVCD